MTNSDDMLIRETARRICAAQAEKEDSFRYQHFLSGRYDETVWMRLTEEGVRQGIKIARAIYAD